ncbi:hypothetical protein G647_03715 [Cladophialophora carrionii CBS 160.54]|uniref:Uncharacterized protein n=1 Tax=Cladophialophora carrionii CBS 160.54 TaxID=1279043 RepID=V9DCC1_9EURO|nr:uncharacterized protein G647_03715 [Cladophialophora carrionii CBS 160.54]ETI24346.1 hypothetical protein G647_03715 [Cladophialophora carrionii CBS 160.54]
MATLAPLSTPARQPFGILNDSKLRSLQSLKNRQNAITPSSVPTSLKRRAPSPEVEGGSDSENIDPNILDSLSKRKRSALEDDASASKSHHYSLNVTPSAFQSSRPRLGTTVVSTPRLNTSAKPSAAPASAPAAGRSPTRKRSSGHLQSRKRFNPPAFAPTQSPSLSLSAALNGTKKARPSSRRARNGTIETSRPKSWFFDIYEESEETQDYRMNEWTMTQSTTGLDISDDESKSLHKNSSSADKGKENIDPNELPTAPVTRSRAAAAAVTEKEIKMNEDDQARTPLGDLNPAQFFPEGLDATSVVLVHDDEEAETDVEGDASTQQHDFTFQASAAISSSLPTSKVIEHLDAPSLAEILSSATTDFNHNVVVGKTDGPGLSPTSSDARPQADADGDVEIEIWESASAKDENERVDLPGSPCSAVGDEAAFALQDL